MRPRISKGHPNRSPYRPGQPRALGDALRPASLNLRSPPRKLRLPVRLRLLVPAMALLAGNLRPTPASAQSLAGCRAHRRRRGFSWRSLLGFARALRHLDPFFPACGVLVGPYDRGVGHPPVEVRLPQGLENHLPASLFCPVVEALIDRIILTETLWEIRPGSPSACNPEHRVQKAAVILGIATGVTRFSRKQRLKALVLLVGQFIAP